MVHTKIRPRIKIKYTNADVVTSWCMKKIGPKLFHLHNRQGGQGWKIYGSGQEMFLELEDSRMMTMLVLTLGDKL
jgi:hypothetical protein